MMLGILRPDRPIGPVADADARVLEFELRRRLGDVALDLRVDGDPIGPWRSRPTASWPDSVDAVLDGSALWRADPPITSLFGRTVDDRAASVRRRMLRHLGILPETSFIVDDAMLDELLELQIRSTDLWIIATAASEVVVDDRSVAALAANPSATLDAVLDDIAATVVAQPEPALQRLRAERDAARSRVAELTDELVRVQSEMVDHLDELVAEIAVLRERTARHELDLTLDP